MNILTDTAPFPVRLAIASERRFQGLVAEVERLNATVLGLNEVSRTSLSVLLSAEFIRQHYFVSELPDNVNGTLNGPHGCVLLSKLPLEQCYALDRLSSNHGKRNRCPVVGVVRWSGKPMSICSLHTVAYQTKRNMILRAKEIETVSSFLKSLNFASRVIMGDLNMHASAEDIVVGANGLLDLWAETHFGVDGDNDPGFTFDANRNSMIPRYIPGEKRRMRLDRILCNKGAAFIPETPCALWGDEAVDALADLFLSDHYGLVVDLTPAPEGFQGSADVHALLEANGRKDFVEYNVSACRFAVALLFHSAWLMSRLLGISPQDYSRL